jgi:hypothetical protein
MSHRIDFLDVLFMVSIFAVVAVLVAAFAR